MTHYDITLKEKELQDFWARENIYKFDENSTNPIFDIDTPPPTISGNIHIGHIFSYTQAEIIARYKKMSGYNVFYPFGFDDNGLPTERLAEKEIGKKSNELSREDFSKSCLDITNNYRKQFKTLWQSMGFSVDWDLAYSTISKQTQKTSQTSFLKLLEKGVVYQKLSPTLWCTECQTAIAQADIDKKDLPSIFYDIEFNILVDNSPIIISTTRPEFINACVGIFVNEKDDRYKHLIGKEAITPFGDKINIYTDENVDISKGSGAVMCCSYGDETDILWIKKYSLPEKNILDKYGKIQNTNSIIDGMYYKKARKTIIEILEKNGKLKSSKDIIHCVGVHDRCSTEIEILTVKQWFIKTINEKDTWLNLGNEINWHPEHMKKRYEEWVENLKWDWCISRQRNFGISIPIWYSKKTGEIITPDLADLPINPLNTFPKKLPLNHTIDDIIPEYDVFDTWATSSLTPLINKGFFENENFLNDFTTMSLRPQAHDIIRTWAFYTIVMSYYHTAKIPFKNLMISGHVLASKGEKISKSKNNEKTTPTELIQKYGADPVRYWASSGMLGKDIIFDEKEIKNGQRLITKLYNVYKLLEINCESFSPNPDYKLSKIDKYIIQKTFKVGNIIKNHLENYNTGLALIEFEKFFYTEFCDNYLEIFKGIILLDNSLENIYSAKMGFYTSFLNILKLIAPFLPHISDEIYINFFKKFEKDISIHKTNYLDLVEIDDNLADEINILFEKIQEIRKFKADNNIKYGQEIEEINIFTKENEDIILNNFLPELKAISRAKEIKFIKR